MNKNRWSGFFANLLGIILGIALTFGVNSLWQQREEKKKTKEILILVRNELETNKEWFKSHERILRKDSEIYAKILENKGNLKAIPLDTMNVYLSQMLSWSDFQLTTSAWQVFQNSELIQKMANKELVIRLTDCYFMISKSQEVIMKEYYEKKMKTNVFDFDAYKYFDKVLQNKESAFFYFIMSSNPNVKNAFWNIFPMMDATIDYTIMLLDKFGDFRYDMKEKDSEFESFINARIDSVQKNDSIQKQNKK